jgi:hypothetical protein
LASLRLGTPTLSLDAELTEGRKWTAELYFQDRGKGPSRLKAFESEPSSSLNRAVMVERNSHKVYVVESEDARKFRELTEDSLRNRTEPFVFERSDIQQVSFELDGKAFKAVEKDGVWKLVEPLPGMVFEGSRMFSVLQSLKALEVAEFENRQPRKGEAWKYKMDLQKADGTSLVTFWFGGTTRKGSKDLVLIRSSRFPEVVTIEKEK